MSRNFAVVTSWAALSAAFGLLTTAQAQEAEPADAGAAVWRAALAALAKFFKRKGKQPAA